MLWRGIERSKRLRKLKKLMLERVRNSQRTAQLLILDFVLTVAATCWAEPAFAANS